MEYVGERKNGKAEGTGILYYSNGQVAYVGQWDDGKPDGYGVWYYSN